MIFQTNTLGSKLVTGTLKSHSEQLNKYVAGLMDTDGSISFEYNHTQQRAYLRVSLSQAATVDTDFTVLRSLYKHYALGTLSYGYQENGISYCKWRMSTKDSRKLNGLVGKHMRVKQTHFDNMCSLDLKQPYEVLREFSEKSRRETSWFKKPKHLSWAYVAGLIDGDGCYRIRRKANRFPTLCVKVAMKEDFILEQLLEDFSGSINHHSENLRCWRRGLGKGHIKFSLPFLKKMRMFSCLESKQRKIQEMIGILQVAETKRLEIEISK